MKDKSTLYRYLQGQGFSGDQIHYALAEANSAVGEWIKPAGWLLTDLE